MWLSWTNILNSVPSKNQDNLKRITFGLGQTARTVLGDNVVSEDGKLRQLILPRKFWKMFLIYWILMVCQMVNNSKTHGLSAYIVQPISVNWKVCVKPWGVKSWQATKSETCTYRWAHLLTSPAWFGRMCIYLGRKPKLQIHMGPRLTKYSDIAKNGHGWLTQIGTTPKEPKRLLKGLKLGCRNQDNNPFWIGFKPVHASFFQHKPQQID